MRYPGRVLDVVSACPLRVGSILWQTGAGAPTLTVVCKATYDLMPVESPLAQAQDEPNEIDEYWNDDEQRSLHAPSDLAPFKRHADVILVGHAFAPGAQAVRSLAVRLVVGDVDKSVEVFGERGFTLDGQLREGPRFTKMPLRWERAAGGPDTSNPVGVRADAAPDRFGMVALPNLQPPGMHVTTRGDFIPPAGLGPISPAWLPRRSKLHAHLAGWDHRRWSELPLPVDLDPSFFNAAPSDQQVDAIRPNERVVLENLHPEHPRLVTSLAAVTPRVTVDWAGGGTQELGMRCDTLMIDTDRATCTLTWRAQIPLDHPSRAGRVTVSTSRAGARPDEGAQRRRRLDPGTLDGPVPAGAGELPFLKSPAPSPRASSPDAGLAPPPSPRAGAPGFVMPTSAVERTLDAPIKGARPALPFRVGRSPLAGTQLGVQPAAHAPTVREAAPRVNDFSWGDTGDEPTGPVSFPQGAVPFGAAGHAPTPAPRGPEEDDKTQPELPAVSAAPPRWMPSTAAPSPSPSPGAAASWSVPVLADARRPEPPAPVEQAAALAAPPPMIGPLATSEMYAVSSPEPASELEPEPASDPEPASEPPPPPPLGPLPLEAYPLERCAAIAASIARTRSETARILDEHELTPERWSALDAHWTQHVRALAGRGRSTPLKAYDEAYVGQLEKERGPIRPEQLAGLLVAIERGAAEEELARLSLPKGALLRVQRVWLQRTAIDAELGKAVRRAIEEAREA